MATDYDAIFKAYDVRGTVGDQIDADGVRAIGGAFARFVSSSGATAVLVGRDMRPEGEEFAAAFGEGVLDHGVDVVDVGLCATDMLYYASGSFDLPGAVFTASHNPAGYNGIKMCGAGAAPIGADTGLDVIKAMAVAGPDPAATTGTRTSRDLLSGYVAHVHSFVDTDVAGPTAGGSRHRQRHGRPGGASSVRWTPLGARPPVSRVGRHLSQPPGRPPSAREPAGLARPGAGIEGRRWDGLRRGCRPHVPSGRERPPGIGVIDHRHHRPHGPRAGSLAPPSSTT